MLIYDDVVVAVCVFVRCYRRRVRKSLNAQVMHSVEAAETLVGMIMIIIPVTMFIVLSS